MTETLLKSVRDDSGLTVRPTRRLTLYCDEDYHQGRMTETLLISVRDDSGRTVRPTRRLTPYCDADSTELGTSEDCHQGVAKAG
jgi:hypothetical protein